MLLWFWKKVLVVSMEVVMVMKNKEKGDGREGEDGGHVNEKR